MKKHLFLPLLFITAFSFASCGPVNSSSLISSSSEIQSSSSASSTSEKESNVKSISLDKTSIEVFLNEAITLTCTIDPIDSGKTYDKTFSIDVVDTSIVSFPTSGVSEVSFTITPKKKGSTVLTVTSREGNKKATCEITIKEAKIEGKVDTYLVLGKIGLYKSSAGEDFPDLFLENTIKYTSEVGTLLPKEEISSTSGATFKGWARYESEQGSIIFYDKVLNENNAILYAQFENTVPPIPDPEKGEYFVVGAGSFVTSEWSALGGINLTKNGKSEDPNAISEYYATILFEDGDLWKITDAEETVWIQMNCLESSTCVKNGDVSTVEDGFGGYNARVNTSGSYTIYFKIYENASLDGTSGYSMWIEKNNS